MENTGSATRLLREFSAWAACRRAEAFGFEATRYSVLGTRHCVMERPRYKWPRSNGTKQFRKAKVLQQGAISRGSAHQVLEAERHINSAACSLREAAINFSLYLSYLSAYQQPIRPLIIQTHCSLCSAHSSLSHFNSTVAYPFSDPASIWEFFFIFSFPSYFLSFLR